MDRDRRFGTGWKGGMGGMGGMGKRPRKHVSRSEERVPGIIHDFCVIVL